jgi:hypothetical protein
VPTYNISKNRNWKMMYKENNVSQGMF